MPPSASDESARFRSDLIAASDGLSEGVIGLAVSGGPDSMAMLTLAAEALPGRVSAATFDHRLREASRAEAVLVANHCAAIGVPHVVLEPELAIAGASLQAAARRARYAALARWSATANLACVATAHHADDQAETFLMRAARASGSSGLAGVRRRVVIDDVTIVRPLLDWRRAELRAIVRRARVPFVEDPANNDDRHDRTRYRRLLEANEWLDPPAIARAAAHLGEAERDMQAMLDLLAAERISCETEAIVARIADLPRAFRRQLLRDAIVTARAKFEIEMPAFGDATNIESLLDRLEDGNAATQGGLRIAPERGSCRLRVAPTRRSH